MFHKLTKKVIDGVNHHKDDDAKIEKHTATELHEHHEHQPSLHKETRETELTLKKDYVVESSSSYIAPTSAPICDGVTFSENVIIKEPIVQETIREDTFTEVQTVIHRDIEKRIVNHITQHVTVAPAPSLAGTVQKAPIIEEVIHTTEVDEIQPIIHRELAQQVVQHEEKLLNEHIVEPTLHTYDVVIDKVPQRSVEPLAEIVESKEATVLTTVKPTTHESHKKNAIIDNTVRTDVLVEVQPIVHRDIDKKVVHHIDRHVTEAPAPSLAGAVEKPAIVHENFHRLDTTEVQPVIHRELAHQNIEKKEVHVTESIREPTLENESVVVEASNFETPAPRALVVEDKPATVIETFAPVDHQKLTMKPIVDEKIRTDVLIETQPIITRDIDQPVIHHVEKHITEAPAPSLAGVLKKAAIIEETVHVTEVDDITPVVHTETAEQIIEKREEHITEAGERLPTKVINDVVYEKSEITSLKKQSDLSEKLSSDLSEKLVMEGKAIQ